jgi:hypothetical protein
MDIKNEVFNDFQSQLEKIDFTSYNPTSSEFMSAIFTGIMWYLLCKMNKDEIPVKEEIIEDTENSSDDISTEINSAKKYLQKYIETKDELYRDIFNDKIKTVGILIKKANAKLPAGDDKKLLKNYEETYKELMNQTDKL